MNKKEISEIRRRVRRDRSNMTAIYGCYVNEKKEIVSQFRRSTATMTENEAEKYFHILKRVLYGDIGKNLVDLSFRTSQVADSAEHRLLMKLREAELKEEEPLNDLFQKIIEAVNVDFSYLILIGCDTYDVPFKNKNDETENENSDEAFKYLLCAICPVKPTKPTLHYIPEEKEFHDGGIINVAGMPELGFMFPAFDDRSTNIYNALLFTHGQKIPFDSFVTAIFNTVIPKPAKQQKELFQALVSNALEKACTMDVVQGIHSSLSNRIAMHKEAKIPEPLMVSKEDIAEVLEENGVEEERIAKFRVCFDQTFGTDEQIHPQNIINERHFEIQSPDVVIRVTPGRSDLVETRVIGGVKYIMIAADEQVEVSGINIHIGAEPTN